MRYLALFILPLLFAACNAPQKKEQQTEPAVRPFAVESVSIQTRGGMAFIAADKAVKTKNLSEMPLVLDNGVIVIGQNLVLQLAQADSDFLSLYISAVNPKDAQQPYHFHLATQINIYAIGKHDNETPLTAFSGQNPSAVLNGQKLAAFNKLSHKVDFQRGQLFLREIVLQPGQSSSGVLYLENKKVPKYKITLNNELETFEFILNAAMR
jgi:hypothetical protein